MGICGGGELIWVVEVFGICRKRHNALSLLDLFQEAVISTEAGASLG